MLTGFCSANPKQRRKIMLSNVDIKENKNHILHTSIEGTNPFACSHSRHTHITPSYMFVVWTPCCFFFRFIRLSVLWIEMTRFVCCVVFHIVSLYLLHVFIYFTAKLKISIYFQLLCYAAFYVRLFYFFVSFFVFHFQTQLNRSREQNIVGLNVTCCQNECIESIDD